jgi:predicted NAD/FAD-dependent oxidoreductase
MTQSPYLDVVVIGAGIAGLSCAQQLQQAGYRVAIVEKSRGVGGRVATRRLYGTFADHGTCYLSPKGDLFRGLIDHLVGQGILQTWLDAVYELEADGNLRSPAAEERNPRYAAPNGMTAIAKFLATNLDIRLNQRAIALSLAEDQYWKVTAEFTNPESSNQTTDLLAKAVVVAAPAPQTVALLQPLVGTAISLEFLNRLESVTFLPCLSAIAGYPTEVEQQWLNQYSDIRAISFSGDPDLAWIGLDSSKRVSPSQPVFVIQSTATFAENYLETSDLQPAGDRLLKQAAERLTPWLAEPEWLQVHRWRYAFAKSPLPEPFLEATTPSPLVCIGDWCGGMRVESAFLSGLEAAEQVNSQLQNLPLASTPLWEKIAQASIAH